MRNLRRDVPLARFTSFGIGGSAEFLYHSGDTDEVLNIIALADTQAVTVLGSGTNVLVHDRGVEGLVLRLYRPDSQLIPTVDDSHFPYSLVTVFAGMPLSALVTYAVSRNLAGIECLAGIPGTVGGAVVQNAGAYGQEIGDVVFSAKVIDADRMALSDWSNADLGFRYRDSSLKHSGNLIITEVTLRLEYGGNVCRRHPEVIALTGGHTTLRGAALVVESLRRGKGMIIGQNAGAGSFFENPTANEYDMDHLRDFFGDGDQGSWARKVDDRHYRVSAAKLIMNAGFQPGYTMGKAGLSPKHVLALVNLGGAGYQDILDLAKAIRGAVHDKFDITLNPEVRFLGFYDEDPIGW